jgi:hypothetical protein
MRVKERYELAAEMSERYRVATKAERGALLNAFCLARGYERKHAIKVDRLYTELLRQYNNCFQPTLKLIGKRQVGERTRKLYDRPRTPLQRVLDSGAADPTKIPTLVDLYTAVSPLALKLPERQDLH